MTGFPNKAGDCKDPNMNLKEGIVTWVYPDSNPKPPTQTNN